MCSAMISLRNIGMDVAAHHSGPSARFIAVSFPQSFKCRRSGTSLNRKRCPAAIKARKW
jgi:hypothetical protein